MDYGAQFWRDVAGKTIIVTGGSRGIGAAIAETAVRHGANVALVATTERVVERANRLGAEGPGETRGFIADVSDADRAKAVAAEVVSIWRRVDGLVHCAGILGPTGPAVCAPPEEWRRTIDVNLVGTFNWATVAARQMESRGGGRIVLFSGGGSAYSYPNFSAYAASKTAVVRLAECLADELHDTGTLVFAIAPGAIETDMLKQVRMAGGEVRATAGIEYPLRLVGFLLTQDADRLNGCFIHVKNAYEQFARHGLPDRDSWRLRRIGPEE